MPLNAILGFAQTLEFDTGDPLSPAQNKQIKSILAASDQIRELLNEEFLKAAEVPLCGEWYGGSNGESGDAPVCPLRVICRLHGHCVDKSAPRAEADVIGGKADVEIEGLLSARERTFSRQAQKVRS